jgi:1-acyl-sn-glycerol-3-phosphate acyltransferase
MKYVITGDVVPRDEACVMMCNHRNRLDWLFLWGWLFRFGRLWNEKIVLKA